MRISMREQSYANDYGQVEQCKLNTQNVAITIEINV